MLDHIRNHKKYLSKGGVSSVRTHLHVSITEQKNILKISKKMLKFAFTDMSFNAGDYGMQHLSWEIPHQHRLIY